MNVFQKMPKKVGFYQEEALKNSEFPLSGYNGATLAAPLPPTIKSAVTRSALI